MSPFNSTNKMPEVYFVEETVLGAIPGAATGIVGIVGLASQGPPLEPTRVTNFTQFTDTFGTPSPAPARFGPYACQGFFGNGGQFCWYVRVTNAATAELPLHDRSAGVGVPTLNARARTEGAVGNGYTVEVRDGTITHPVTALDTAAAIGDVQISVADATGFAPGYQLVIDAETVTVQSAAPATNTIQLTAALTAAHAAGAAVVRLIELARPTTVLAVVATAGDTQVSVNDASGFRPSDRVDIGGESATVQRIDNAANTLFLVDPLGAAHANAANVRIADLVALTTDQFRVTNSAGIEPGSIIGITPGGGGQTEEAMVRSVEPSNHIITLRAPLTAAYPMGGAAAPTVQSAEFSVLVLPPGAAAATTYANLSMENGHSRHYATVLGADGARAIDLVPVDPVNTTPPPHNRPRVSPAANLQGGQDEDLSTIGNANFQAGIDALARVPDINILCVPDSTTQAVQDHLITHCTELNRFAILDPEQGASVTRIQTIRGLIGSPRGYAALYYPRIYVAAGDDRILIPPSGHLAGVFARTDEDKGVHKAPANEVIRGALDIERALTEGDAGLLNEQGVNILRNVRNRGRLIWGARTITSPTTTQWRYVNVRRLVTFIEESLRAGTRAAVFNPNGPPLWANLKRVITDFLTKVWKSGALYGDTPEQGFRVRIDEELNPASSMALGELHIRVELRPTPPAEFIVFTIIQDTSRALVEES